MKLPHWQPSTEMGNFGEMICFLAIATLAPIPIQRVKANADIDPPKAPFQFAHGKNMPKVNNPRRGPVTLF